MPEPRVVATCRRADHGVGKDPCPSIRLVTGEGVEGDAHRGTTVQHRSRVRQDPTQPNLRQVHVIHSELLSQLNERFPALRPGVMGENITTEHLDVLSLPRHTRLHIGSTVLRVTGLRNPCVQLDELQPGLMSAVLDRTPDGSLIRKAGIMAIVEVGGDVRPGDAIRVELPPAPHEPLDRV